MKIFDFKLALAMLTFSAMSLFFQAPSQAQVNKKLLSDVIKGCHRDINIDYFEKMGMKESYLYNSQFSQFNTLNLRKNCINYRYRHMALAKQLPWLPFSGDVIPEYSASVAISEILFEKTKLGGAAYYEEPKRILSCLIDQDPKSVDCSVMWRRSGYTSTYRISDMVPYICPKCAISLNDSSSIDMIKGILKWFLSLDKQKRRELVSAFDSSLDKEINGEGWLALQTYENALKKIEQDDKEQRRRNLLGQ